MARDANSAYNQDALLRQIDALQSELGQLKRQKPDVADAVKRQRRRLRPIEPELWGELDMHRSPYLCRCKSGDHRMIWVNKRLFCPFTVICKVGILELKGLSTVPIEKIVELSKM